MATLVALKLVEYVPARHSVHDVVPLFTAYNPAAQFKQALMLPAPADAEYVPDRQAVHKVDPDITAE